MTKCKLLLLALFALAAMPLATAHTAAPPPDHIQRLLHDCNDDYFGSDGGGGDGYDLHAFDVYEAWENGLGNVVTFKTILNGQGGADIVLDLTAGGSAQSFQWTTSSGSSWSGDFDDINRIADVGDGDRFALEGSLRLSTLGVDIGDKLTDYSLTVELDSGEGDHVPGYDGGPLGSCQDQYNPPSKSYTLEGPTQYGDLSTQEASATVEVDELQFINVEFQNALKDNAQTFTLTHSGGDGVLVQFHSASAGDDSGYSDTFQKDLAKRGRAGDSTLVHLAVTGEEEGASGTITVTAATDLGGREQASLPYTVTAASGPGGGTDGDGASDGDGAAAPDNESPGIGALAVLVFALVAWAARRRT